MRRRKEPSIKQKLQRVRFVLSCYKDIPDEVYEKIIEDLPDLGYSKESVEEILEDIKKRYGLETYIHKPEPPLRELARAAGYEFSEWLMKTIEDILRGEKTALKWMHELGYEDTLQFLKDVKKENVLTDYELKDLVQGTEYYEKLFKKEIEEQKRIEKEKRKEEVESIITERMKDIYEKLDPRVREICSTLFERYTEKFATSDDIKRIEEKIESINKRLRSVEEKVETTKKPEELYGKDYEYLRDEIITTKTDTEGVRKLRVIAEKLDKHEYDVTDAAAKKLLTLIDERIAELLAAEL